MTKNIRPIRIEGNIAYVPLTRGYKAVIDAADVPLVDGYNWYAMIDGSTVYAVRTDRTGTKQRQVLMHRTILGEPDGFDIDHRDGEGLNNRRNNLRVATKSQNMHNRRISSNNTSGYKGVSWNNRDRKWQAFIKINRKPIYLGYHDTPEAAHAAYCEASARYHKGFGRTE